MENIRDKKGKFVKGHKRTSPETHSEETKKKISLSLRINKGNGLKNHFWCWNRGKKGIYSKQHKQKLSKLASERIGEKSSNWQGGLSFEKYNKEFNNKFKRIVRKRDNQICMLCEIHREKLKRALYIHHINYDKNLTIVQNCISLCNSCHSKTNGNREKWTYFFQSLLADKYNYQYENEKIILEVQNGS